MDEPTPHANVNGKRIFDAQCQSSHHEFAKVKHIPTYANIDMKYEPAHLWYKPKCALKPQLVALENPLGQRHLRDELLPGMLAGNKNAGARRHVE